LRIKRQPVEKARIELIPMIDTMAFLLVFFMIASLAMTQQLGVPVKLPRAASATEQPSSDRTLVVSVDRHGRLSLNKQTVRWGELEPAVHARLQARPGLIVVLNADEGLRHGFVMRVMDALKRAGAEQLSIATTRPEYARTTSSQ
jgi:biopolymer transport protein ExbD